MRAFGYEERDRFFGRDQQSYALYRLLAFGFIAVIGNSGSGKSSLVRAGLLPILLGPRETKRWRIATMTPGAEPLDRLGEAIADLGPEDEDEDARSIRRERIAYRIRLSSSGIADALDEMPHLAEDSVLLIVDQFEEIFRNAGSSSSAENEAFVQLLLEFHRRRPSGRVLITMRSDFIGDCALFPGLPEAVSDTQYLVPTLTREQRRTAICKPIAAANATIESDLVERLLNEEEFGSDLLPVLQHALSRMWIVARERSPGAVHVADADYRAIGTLQGAISQHADGVLHELDGLQNVVEAVFRALSERDFEGRATRRVLSLRQLVAETGLSDDDVRAVVDRFRAPDCAFLLPAGGALTGDTNIDVVHEALLRRWERLTPSDAAEQGWLDREWLDGQYYRSLLARIDSGETTLQLDRVTERYAWWTSTPHTDAWAMRYGGRHDRVDEFFAASRAALAESERARAQAEAEERERRIQKERATRRFLIVTGSVATIAIVLLVVTFFALLGAQRTTNESLTTQSDLVARDAKVFADHGDATNAALLALEVLPQHLTDPDRPFTQAAYGALTDALANVREVRDYQLNGQIDRIEYTHDGTRFVAFQSDGTIWIWKIGAPRPELILHAQAYAEDVSFSADGALIASGSTDGSIHIWNARSGRIIRVIRGCRESVIRTIFSADGRRILTSCAEDVTRVYDVSTGHLLRQLPGFISWAPDEPVTSHDLLIIGDPSKVTIRNASLTKALHAFPEGRSPLVAAAMDANERRIAITYEDKTADVFDVSTGRRVAHLSDADGIMYKVWFDRSGARVITNSDTSVRAWDAVTGSALTTIPSDTPYQNTSLPEFSRDSKRVVLPSNDGSLGVYSVELGARLVSVVGTSATVNDASFSPAGDRMLVPSLSDGIVRELDVSTNTSRILDGALDLDPNGSGKIAVASNGSIFAVGGADAIRIYEARTGKIIRSLPGVLRDLVGYVGSHSFPAFSPDERTLLYSLNNEPGVQRWDWQRAKRLPALYDEKVEALDQYHLHSVYAPDGRTVASNYRGIVRIQDAHTGRVMRSVSGNHFTLSSLAFSADGGRLLTGGNDGWIRVYNARSGEHLLAFRAAANWIRRARFSPDGRFIASASLDQTVRVWRATSGAPVASLDTNGQAFSVAFSADGKRLLIGADDGVRIWDFATNRTIVAFRGFTGGVEDAEFALHDTRVITLGFDGTARLWTMPKLPVCQDAIDEAHKRMAHELTPALRNAEFITPRHSPSILNALLPSQACS